MTPTTPAVSFRDWLPWTAELASLMDRMVAG